MKNFSIVIVVLLLSLLIGCGKTNNSDKTDVKSTDKKAFVSGFACKIDGKDFIIPDSLCYVKKDDKSFSIYAKVEVENGQYDDVFFFINVPLKVGEFALSKENNPGHVQYKTNKDKTNKSEYDQYWTESGNLVVTKVDDKKLEGTFNLIATGDIDGTEKKINMTEGKLKVDLK
jgi:hypothetical protein